MKILYSGRFLREGLEQLGCEIVPFQPDAGMRLDDQAAEMGVTPDYVLLELFGKSVLPKAMHTCRYRLAAYCIDSPINAFWLKPLMRLFDLVYVDQLASVQDFRRDRIRAQWLPLCVSEKDFRAPAAKEHFITFVGRTSEFRIKRSNLLGLVRKHHDLNIVQNVSHQEMLDVFARSRVVLNENFFPGLNLRFLHALASSSLLLTERGGDGVDRLFSAGRHYLSYGPDNILHILQHLSDSPDDYLEVARAGHQACRRYHTSRQRAQTVLENMRSAAPSGEGDRKDEAVHEARGKYFHAVRFGGLFTEPVTMLHQLAQERSSGRELARNTLAGVYFRAGRTDDAERLLDPETLGSGFHGLVSAMQHLVSHITGPGFHAALMQVTAALNHLGIDIRPYAGRFKAVAQRPDHAPDVFLLCCDILYDQGLVFEPGFQKQHREAYPDFALEYATLAFEARPGPDTLQAVIKCTAKVGLAAEALPYIKRAILEGAASDRQIALSASLAQEYYDLDYAGTAVRHLSTRLKSSRKR